MERRRERSLLVILSVFLTCLHVLGQNSDSCQTVDGGVGNCVSIYDCEPYLRLLQTSGTNAAVILRRAHCGFVSDLPRVCCPIPGVSEGSNAAVTLPDPPVCGVSIATQSGLRIFEGIDADLGDFPWMALLGYNRNGRTEWMCGGTLITSRHVLTAGHCIYSNEDTLQVVRLGELDLAKDNEGATPIDIPIKQKVIHEQYNPTDVTNDIAVLVLSATVSFTDLIRPICIPKSSEFRSRSFENYTSYVAGWGLTGIRGPPATHLQYVRLPVLSNDFCAKAYSAYKSQTIDQKMICAGFKEGGPATCKGDSGGPLMESLTSTTTFETFFYQIGVVSFGLKYCIRAALPGVYSRVTDFVPWIEQVLRTNT